jgi:hypothetical protein
MTRSEFFSIVAGALFGLLVFSVLNKAFGAEVKSVAPDGVNEITMEMAKRGCLSAISSTAVHVAQDPLTNVLADVDDIELKAKYEAIRIARDSYEREYVVIYKSEWLKLTNTVEKLRVIAERRWKNEHATEEGRRAWHGAVKRKTVAEDGSSVEWVYADGYVYVQNVAPARRVSPRVKSVKNGLRSAPNQNQYKHLPPRLRAKRLAQDAQGRAREVNAVVGPGGKVLKVEDAK